MKKLFVLIMLLSSILTAQPKVDAHFTIHGTTASEAYKIWFDLLEKSKCSVGMGFTMRDEINVKKQNEIIKKYVLKDTIHNDFLSNNDEAWSKNIKKAKQFDYEQAKLWLEYYKSMEYEYCNSGDDYPVILIEQPTQGEMKLRK
jgi:hypothetical protein